MRQVVWGDGEEELRAERRGCYPESTTDQRQHQTLRELLTDQPTPNGSQRGSNRHFSLLRHAASQHEVGHVDRSDE